MSTRMLIDARHPEETRVCVIKGSRVEEFDYESSSRRQLKGNIYLARVTRVEPSLQAAFVEYGGNRHGFLAFSEIHPDYYQVPVEDREELIAEEVQAAEDSNIDEIDVKTDNGDEGDSPDVQDSAEEEKDAEIEEAAARRRSLKAMKRKYNIQEVIKRRQVLLVQVVKEERGNKGAALTTYLSLAGRYCVLMPNSTHSGGISRKISSATDRKRLKKMISDLEVPEEMGLIVRTAGMKRTKTEIKRDYEYMLRLWNGIREKTLESVAPALVYEEGNLIKRSIRDLYTREVDEILVEGDNGYRAAKDFMKLLMPSHAKKVQHYKDRIPLFHRYQVESHLEAMFQPVVQLRSGGYIVINPTEALISIDVNSGRSTREHNIEETALKTNLEASEEVARQLRLRDMAGLVVIDYIDMEERNNNRAVERRMKEVLKADRARIQVGRISSFGLMEMSRQRLRPNLLEVSMETCPHCQGTGVVRSVESAALMVLRALEEEGIRGRSSIVRVTANPEVAVYLLNKKRSILSELESRYEFTIEILSSPSTGTSEIEITREAVTSSAKSDSNETSTAISQDLAAASAPEVADVQEEKAEDDKPRRKRRRRRRRRRGAGDQGADAVQQDAQDSSDDEASDEKDAKSDETEASSDSKPRRRRGSRGGRRRRSREDTPQDETGAVEEDTSENPEKPAAEAEESGEAASDDKPPRRRRRKNADSEAGSNTADATATDETPAPNGNESVDTVAADTAEEKPKRRRRRKAEPEADNAETTEAAAEAVTSEGEEPKVEEKPKRRTRKKAVKSEEDAEGASNETDDAKSSNTEEVPEKPKRRRRTTKAAPKAESVEKTSTAEANGTEKPAADEKPKRRTRRTKKTEDDASNGSVAPVTEAKAEAPVAAPATPKESVKSKPVDKPVQSITVTHDGDDAKSSDIEPTDGDGPKRKGWWQRTFG